MGKHAHAEVDTPRRYAACYGLQVLERRVCIDVFVMLLPRWCLLCSENVGTGITDPLSSLIYRVHPLPESMIDHVFDFGALAPATERLYIKAMLRRQLAQKSERKDEKVTACVRRAHMYQRRGDAMPCHAMPCDAMVCSVYIASFCLCPILFSGIGFESIARICRIRRRVCRAYVCNT